jgi:hypothetical protein
MSVNDIETINLPVQSEHRKLKARWTMEASQDMNFWHELQSQYSQNESNAFFKNSDFVFDEPTKMPILNKRSSRSIDDPWES